MEKFIQNGKVAVLYSPGYGAGWWTWNKDKPESRDLVFSPAIVKAVLRENRKKAAELALKINPEFYVGGADTLEIEWIDQDEAFEIEEYDGYERIELCYKPIFVA